ncbi:hypothetical protein RYX36_020943, partial [Vicia faba]
DVFGFRHGSRIHKCDNANCIIDHNFNQDTITEPMARSFVLCLRGLGHSGPTNELIKTLFTSPNSETPNGPSLPHLMLQSLAN